MPCPDVAVLKGRPNVYRFARPHAADALIVIEVSDTTLEFDTTEKLPRYAAAGIPEVWIVDVAGRCLVRHTESYFKAQTAAYGTVHNLGPGDTIRASGVAVVAFAVVDILGPETPDAAPRAAGRSI